MNILEISNLECIRGYRKLFSELTFAVESGVLLYVQGPNGSGKTTLLRTLCGLLQSQAGNICWNGNNIHNVWEEFCQNLLYLGHLNGIKPDLNAIENLLVTTTLSGHNVPEQTIWQVLDQLGLAGFEDLPTRMLSQGQKRRVALARLLLNRAKLWILDEPFVALDSNAVNLIQQVITDHLAANGLVILTTHQEVALTTGQVHRLQLGNRDNIDA